MRRKFRVTPTHNTVCVPIKSDLLSISRTHTVISPTILPVVGDIYAFGQGVPADDEKAFRFWKKAALNGHAHSQFNIGICYRDGKCPPADPLSLMAFLGCGGVAMEDEPGQSEVSITIIFAIISSGKQGLTLSLLTTTLCFCRIAD